MSILTKFYDYLGVSDNTINGEQLFSLICLLGKENYKLTLKEKPIDMCEHILNIFINGIETGTFRHIEEQDIVRALNCMN